MSTFASTAMPRVRTNPAIPGKVSVESRRAITASTTRPFKTRATSATTPLKR